MDDVSELKSLRTAVQVHCDACQWGRLSFMSSWWDKSHLMRKTACQCHRKVLCYIYVTNYICYYFVTVEYIINSSSCQRVNWGWLPWGKPRATSPMTESWNLSLGALLGEADGICQNFQRGSNAHAHAYHWEPWWWQGKRILFQGVPVLDHLDAGDVNGIQWISKCHGTLI